MIQLSPFKHLVELLWCAILTDSDDQAIAALITLRSEVHAEGLDLHGFAKAVASDLTDWSDFHRERFDAKVGVAQ
jgi:hypothetical protein